MAAKLPPERELLAALNSLVHFQTEYWLYVDPKRAVRLWTHFRDRVEQVIAQISDSVEFAKAAERVRLTDEHILSHEWDRIRIEDFALLDRSDVPTENWWYWLDQVKAGKLKAKAGPLTKEPKTPAAAPTPSAPPS